MRIPVFEFEDFNWFPKKIRLSMMEYLRQFFKITNYYAPVTPLLHDCIEITGCHAVIDLCSGAGGPVEEIQKELIKDYNKDACVILTDLYPQASIIEGVRERAVGRIAYFREPVDATNLPASLTGLRVMFSSIHHFEPADVQKILTNAADSRNGIAIFDIGSKSILAILGIMLFHPVLILVLAPFFKPFRFSTLLFTYILPIIPFCTVWDGVMSILRLYSKTELAEIAGTVTVANYSWTTGKLRNKLGFQVTYLVGLPSSSNEIANQMGKWKKLS